MGTNKKYNILTIELSLNRNSLIILDNGTDFNNIYVSINITDSNIIHSQETLDLFGDTYENVKIMVFDHTMINMSVDRYT